MTRCWTLPEAWRSPPPRQGSPLALLLLVQGLWLCLLLYLLLLVVYFLVWGIRYFQRHTLPPQ